MASIEKKQIEDLIKPYLKQIGFKKKGATWHRLKSDFIQVINIQGSQWSKIFFINLGVYLKELGNEETPVEYKCHIRQRLDSLVPDPVYMNKLCDVHSFGFGDFDRTELPKLLIEYGIPWLEKCCTVEGIKQEIDFDKTMIHKLVKELIK